MSHTWPTLALTQSGVRLRVHAPGRPAWNCTHSPASDERDTTTPSLASCKQAASSLSSVRRLLVASAATFVLTKKVSDSESDRTPIRRMPIRRGLQLGPGQATPVRRLLSPKPLDCRVRLPPVGGLLRHARAVARRELRHRVVHSRARARTDHHDHARPFAGAHEGVLGPRGRVEESQGRRRRSWSSMSSAHSPERTRNASWFASAW